VTHPCLQAGECGEEERVEDGVGQRWGWRWGVWRGGEGRGWSRAEVGMAMGSVERRVKVGIGSKKRGEEGRDGDGECGEERRGG
jgi:hypothetical protein